MTGHRLLVVLVSTFAFAVPCASRAAAPAPAAAASATPGKDRTETLITTFKKVLKDEGKLTDAQKAANAKLFVELDGYLDFETLTSKPIAPRLDKFKGDEIAKFKGKFRELIRMIAYPNAGNFFRKATYTFQPEQVKGALTLVPIKVKLPEDDMETVVEFQFAKVGGALMIEDVQFEGDSLVKDYQNQLAKIVDKSGVAGLMKAVDERLADLTKGKK